MTTQAATSPSSKKMLAEAIRAAAEVSDDGGDDDDDGGDDESGDDRAKLKKGGGGGGGSASGAAVKKKNAAARTQLLPPPSSGVGVARSDSNSSTSSKSSTKSGRSKKTFRAAVGILQAGVALVDEPVIEGPAVTSEDAIRRPPARSSSSERSFGDDTDDVYKSLHGAKTPGMTVQQLIEHVKEKRKSGIFQEYSDLKQEPFVGTFYQARDKANVDKNRYKDVLCYDHTRVALQPLGSDDSGNDYVNANYVDGYKQRSAYICCMGPLTNTISDFWKMVWQEHVRTIVMTTKCIEKNKAKCAQYWPPTNNGSLAAGPFDVHNAFVDNRGDYEISTLVLTHRKTSRTRTLKHYLFLSWPDYGVPSSPSVLLKFLQDVRQAQAAATASLGDGWKGHQKGPPIVIHCSAGVGRTGTVAAVDICLYRLAETKTVNVQETVRRLRSQRAHSIQMPDQYLFCHLAVIEYAVSSDLVPAVDLSSYVA